MTPVAYQLLSIMLETHEPSSNCFFFNDTATTEIYTLSLHDALPICLMGAGNETMPLAAGAAHGNALKETVIKIDRKSTRLNSSHLVISYAVFCLKKKKKAPTRCSLSHYRLSKYPTLSRPQPR